MSEKQIIKHLLTILLRLENKEEVFAQSQTILHTADIFGVYDKIGRDKKEIHFKAFDDYIYTLGVQEGINSNLVDDKDGVMKEVLSAL